VSFSAASYTVVMAVKDSDRAGISADQATGGQGEDVRPPVASSLLCAGRASNNCVCRQDNMTGIITEGEARPGGQDRTRSP
jgi:hypothetical protein